MSRQYKSIVDMTVNGRKVVNGARAAQILNERSLSERGIETQYTRDRVWQLLQAGKITGEKYNMNSKNAWVIFYDEESVRSMPLPKTRYVHKHRAPTRHVGKEGYPEHVQQRALDLWNTGKFNKREVARMLETELHLGVSYQTVFNWINGKWLKGRETRGDPTEAIA